MVVSSSTSTEASDPALKLGPGLKNSRYNRLKTLSVGLRTDRRQLPPGTGPAILESFQGLANRFRMNVHAQLSSQVLGNSTRCPPSGIFALLRFALLRFANPFRPSPSDSALGVAQFPARPPRRFSAVGPPRALGHTTRRALPHRTDPSTCRPSAQSRRESRNLRSRIASAV